MNPLTDYLAARYDEVSPLDFYSDLFAAGDSLATADRLPGTYAGVLTRIQRGPDNREHGEHHLILSDLWSVEAMSAVDGSIPGTVALISPLTYAGHRPLLRAAHELHALVFDLDDVVTSEDGRPSGLIDLLYQMEDLGDVRGPFLPQPAYMVSSGSGLHLYYVLDEPIRMWPDTCEAVRRFRAAFTRRLWNRYVTSSYDRPQLESVVQSFRAVGSLAKDGQQIVRAFRVGGRVSVEDLNAYVDPDDALPTHRSRHTIEEAKALWPGWDPEWRDKARSTERQATWHVKRDLYDWWVRRVESDPDVAVGHRYWCLFVAAALAAKCPDVTYDELEAWAYGVRPYLDSLTTDPATNPFTPEDVAAALAVYGNPLSPFLRRDKIAEKTALDMPINKRNGRDQRTHLAVARAVRDTLHPDGSWRAGSGRPPGSPNKSHPKRDAVLAYAAGHPGATQREIAAALGVSKTTVNKWLHEPEPRRAEAPRTPLKDARGPARLFTLDIDVMMMSEPPEDPVE